MVSRLAKFIKDTGYAHLAYRSDQEPGLRALFEEAFTKSARQGELYNPRLQQMVPEASSVGESQSNGKAEIAVQKLEDLVRTYKSALETNAQVRIESTSPVMNWMVEHAASVYNRHLCNSDGRTPFETIHGQRWKGRAVEFGEQVFYLSQSDSGPNLTSAGESERFWVTLNPQTNVMWPHQMAMWSRPEL